MFINNGISGTKTRNPVDSFLTTDDFALTVVIVNGQELSSANKDRFLLALNPPVLTSTPIRTGTGGVELTVHAVPHNMFSIRVELPTSGPWVRRTTRDRIYASIMHGKKLVDKEEWFGDQRLAEVVVHGLPNDTEFLKRIEQHELIHVEDNRRHFREILSAWDTALTKVHTLKSKFTGRTHDVAKAALYTQVGGTPLEIMTKFYNAVKTSGDTFHRTPRGGKPWVDHYIMGHGLKTESHVPDWPSTARKYDEILSRNEAELAKVFVYYETHIV